MTMLLQKLKAIRADLDAVISGLDVDTPTVPLFERKPLPSNAKNAYDACRRMWEAAQSDLNKGKGWKKADGTEFTIYDYIPGLQYSWVTRTTPKDAVQMNADITALGFTTEGQAWLSNDKNSSMVDPAYQRHFLGYVAVRKDQQDEAKGYIRVP